MKKILSLTTIILAIVALITLIIFLLKGGKKDVYITHDVIVQQIEELGNLEVVKYNIQDMMEYQKVRRWLPNSKASLKIAGEVIACVDLTKIGKDDIYTKGDSVSLILPIPEICHYRVDHSRSKVYNIEYGLWETAELVDEAYKVAEQQIYQEAINMGIAQDSRESTIKVLTPILRGLGFTKIHIGFKTAEESLSSEKQNTRIVLPKK
ncbi:DUF4230 domain-containing protein [Dysgonomonas sp. OttesenSCG-928-M03]|nr:DUF4230 domain-containing protein [Dysgonomonas sp. OttesenSCG-928-M03]